ncbi:hypothetical protein [Epilithonimonas mollis]|uniref:hypothetical protein n=1 Tax=Epilithonimonas mollis TaxID=216903 RepID=UPI0009351602|nr:hypothetical protein [Epilithonimonas mollis]
MKNFLHIVFEAVSLFSFLQAIQACSVLIRNVTGRLTVYPASDRFDTFSTKKDRYYKTHKHKKTITFL